MNMLTKRDVVFLQSDASYCNKNIDKKLYEAKVKVKINVD